MPRGYQVTLGLLPSPRDSSQTRFVSHLLLLICGCNVCLQLGIVGAGKALSSLEQRRCVTGYERNEAGSHVYPSATGNYIYIFTGGPRGTLKPNASIFVHEPAPDLHRR